MNIVHLQWFCDLLISLVFLYLYCFVNKIAAPDGILSHEMIHAATNEQQQFLNESYIARAVNAAIIIIMKYMAEYPLRYG